MPGTDEIFKVEFLNSLGLSLMTFEILKSAQFLYHHFFVRQVSIYVD